jgi:pimeloyl-ACP methyl ester carboxylesterase
MNLVVGGRAVYAYTGTRAFDPSQPTVMFVHGAATDHGVFALQSRSFAWHGRNVLAVDLPGHGRSAGDALPSGRGARRLAARR